MIVASIPGTPPAGTPTFQPLGVFAGVPVAATEYDLSAFRSEAIVCPANTFLVMRGGVSAVLRERAGHRDQLERDAVALGPLRIGDAVLTKGYALPTRAVIHAPTVEMPVDRASPLNVELALRAALRTAARHSISELALPAMGTGTGGVSYPEAAAIMMEGIRQHLATGESSLKKIWLVDVAGHFSRALQTLPASPTVSGHPSRIRAGGEALYIGRWPPA